MKRKNFHNFIPVYRPYIPNSASRLVSHCLKTNWISSKGEFINEFEEKFCQTFNYKYASTVSNGTVALHLALLALGISNGDEVIAPNFTYIASINSIAYVGATPVLVDVDRDSWNIDPDEIERNITPRTKAIMVVHIYGNPCDMTRIQKIAKKHKLFIIEDVAEALGSKFKSNFCGSFGDVSTFSFFGNKTLTTGEGGMVVSKNKKIHKRVAYLKNQAVSNKRIYWHDEIGYNYRMTNIQAAIGISQIEIIDEVLRSKRDLYDYFNHQFSALPLKFQVFSTSSNSSYWLISFLMKDKMTRDRFISFLAKNNIETRPLFYPVNKMPVFKSPREYPNSAFIADHGISIPSYQFMKLNEKRYIADTVRLFFRNKFE